MQWKVKLVKRQTGIHILRQQSYDLTLQRRPGRAKLLQALEGVLPLLMVDNSAPHQGCFMF
jgi:hypothetical protein